MTKISTHQVHLLLIFEVVKYRKGWLDDLPDHEGRYEPEATTSVGVSMLNQRGWIARHACDLAEQVSLILVETTRDGKLMDASQRCRCWNSLRSYISFSTFPGQSKFIAIDMQDKLISRCST